MAPALSEPPSRYPDPGLVEQARRRLMVARKPVLFIGQGAAGAAEATFQLVETMKGCVVSTSSGRGVVPEGHPRVPARDFGASGSIGLVNELVEESDLVLALGCKFSHNGSSGFRLAIPEEKLIRVDASEESLGGNLPASLSIQADCGSFLEALAAGSCDRADQESAGWTLAELDAWRHRFSSANEETAEAAFPRLAGGSGGSLEAFFRSLRSHLPDDAILVTDSGLHQVAARRWFEVRAPRGLILPSDYQSMAFGIPAAIGAALAVPERKVVAIVGDGGMAMSGLELATATHEGIDLAVVVFNDGHLGQIRLQQLRDFGRAHSTELARIDFRLLAEAVGASYLAMDESNLSALPDALENAGVTVVDLLLEDSAGLRRARTTGLLKASGRRMLPKSGWGFLKRLASRGPS